jgi:predicted porin
MKKKALALAVAGAFFAPASYAAQDNAGMHYTSAAEGFYGSLRAIFHTEAAKDSGAGITSGVYSRFGIRGSNDLGNGLKGFYQYEAGIDPNVTSFDNEANSDDRYHLRSRVGLVGLEGAFGRVWVGTGWAEEYNMVYGSTDLANDGTGNFARVFRTTKSLQYRTPDVGGFQGAVRIKMDAGTDNDGVTNDPKDDNNVDEWNLAAKYSVQGFTGAFSYAVTPDKSGADGDTTKTDDETFWAARLGYGQGNWSVNGWYGEKNTSDFGAANAKDDEEILSIAGNVSVGKVGLFAVHENQDNVKGVKGTDDSVTALGVSYKLGSRSKVWMEYIGRDRDSDTSLEDYVHVGLRHDF